MVCTPTTERKRELVARESIDGMEVWSTVASCGAFWPCAHVVPEHGYKVGEPFDADHYRKAVAAPIICVHLLCDVCASTVDFSGIRHARARVPAGIHCQLCYSVAADIGDDPEELTDLER